jgi:hypothetical protein
LIVASSAYADDAVERRGCPRPRVDWSQDAPLPILRGDGFQGVVLPAEAATAVLCQCSRGSLGTASDYWTPTSGDIVRMENRLPAYLRANAHPHQPQQWRALPRFLRQYLGVERGGRKLIHVNVVGGVLATRPAMQRAWRSTAIVICDGGPDFFSVEFDVVSGAFVRIDFNF